MITDKTLDEAMVEAARFLKAAKALRAARKEAKVGLMYTVGSDHWCIQRDCAKQHAACKRASLDLTHKLADLRAGR